MQDIFLSPRLLDALEFASLAHQDQKRLFPTNIPYICHPFGVGLILHKAGYDEDVVIAGILHDVVEDTYFSDADIRGKFGDRIADLVKDVTEDKTLPHEEMKEDYRQKVKHGSNESKAISAADLLANRVSLLLPLQQSKDPWEKLTSKSKADFIGDDYKRLDVIKEGLGKDNKIVKDIEAVIDEIKKIAQI
jgi:(p)ppGpp synthase/HD superfamily hydrolase